MAIQDFNRLNDLYFKYLLGSEARKNLTLSFLNAILAGGEERFTDIIFTNKDAEPELLGGKLVKLDIKGKLSDGSLIDIEMQVCAYPGMAERSLYYWSRMYSSELGSGEEYRRLKPAIVLNILNFNYLKDEENWHNVYRVLNEAPPHRALTQHLELHYVELPKLKLSDIRSLKAGERWAAYLSGRYTKEEMDMLAVTDPALIEALKAEEYFVADATERERYEEREKAIKDYVSVIVATRDEARDEGIDIGIKKVALTMLRKGKELTEIMDSTELSADTIRNIASQNGLAVL